MTDPNPLYSADCVIVGASFAGLACATALARAGLRVTVLERKSDPGEKLHTTGIIVKDAIDHIVLLDGLPAELIHRIDGVRLYAPNLRHVDLAAPGYYFLATDTPNLAAMRRWYLAEAKRVNDERIKIAEVVHTFAKVINVLATGHECAGRGAGSRGSRRRARSA